MDSVFQMDMDLDSDFFHIGFGFGYGFSFLNGYGFEFFSSNFLIFGKKMSNMFYQNHFNVRVLKLFPLPIDVISKSQNLLVMI